METIKVYKLFRQNEYGILFPLFIDTRKSVPIGKWVEARAPSDEAIKDIREGYAMIDMIDQMMIAYQVEKPCISQLRDESHYGRRWIQIVEGKRGRKVYDLGISSNGKQVVSFAHRPGWHTSLTPSLPGVNMEGKVWAECLIPADEYYTLHRNVSGLSKTHEPIDWMIAKKIFITRLLKSPQTNSIERDTEGM